MICGLLSPVLANREKGQSSLLGPILCMAFQTSALESSSSFSMRSLSLCGLAHKPVMNSAVTVSGSGGSSLDSDANSGLGSAFASGLGSSFRIKPEFSCSLGCSFSLLPVTTSAAKSRTSVFIANLYDHLSVASK